MIASDNGIEPASASAFERLDRQVAEVRLSFGPAARVYEAHDHAGFRLVVSNEGRTLFNLHVEFDAATRPHLSSMEWDGG